MCVNYASSNVLSNEKISEQFNSLSAQPLSVSLPPYIKYFYRSDERLRSALYCYCLRYGYDAKNIDIMKYYDFRLCLNPSMIIYFKSKCIPG